jgi:hypothetical protein
MPPDKALGMAWKDVEAPVVDEEGSGTESMHQRYRPSIVFGAGKRSGGTL